MRLLRATVSALETAELLLTHAALNPNYLTADEQDAVTVALEFTSDALRAVRRVATEEVTT